MTTRIRLGSTVQAAAAKKMPPNAGKGRKKGVLNKNTVALKDAILLAAAEVGADGAGTGGLQGYLQRIALREPKSMAMLLARVLPLQISLDLKSHTATLLDQLKDIQDGTHTATPTPAPRLEQPDVYAGNDRLH